MNRKPASWWEARKAEIHALYYGDMLRQAQIAERYGVSQSAVYLRFKRWGWKARRPEEHRRDPRTLWWEQRKLQVRKLYYVDGLSQEEIARRIGCKRGSVASAMRRWGGKTREARLRCKGKTLVLSPEMARRRSKINVKRQAEALRFWESRRSRIVDGLWQGKTLHEIAAEIDVTAPILARWLPRLGLHRVWDDERDGVNSLSAHEHRVKAGVAVDWSEADVEEEDADAEAVA